MIEWGDRLLYLAGVPPEKLTECLEWAFGKIDPAEKMSELANRWNVKHGDIFIVSADDNPKAFVWSIGKAYVLRVLPDHKIILPAHGGLGRFN
jgi:hypothetical protein